MEEKYLIINIQEQNNFMLNIDTLIKSATLSKDKVALNAYKNIKSEFQKVKTAKNYKGDWNDQLEIQIISKYGRILEDAILQFSEAHRDDLVAEYTSELEIVKKLLPEPVNESQICSFISEDEFFNKYNYEGSSPNFSNYTIQIPKKEMGIVIKYLKSKFPTADGKMISEIVKKYII